jgi:hypothetical protein
MSTSVLASFTSLARVEGARAPSGDPCSVLGWMLQLQGTIQIAGLLDALPRPNARVYADAEPLAGAWEWRIDAIERAALEPLRNPFRGRGGLLDAVAAVAWLRDTNALAAPTEHDLGHGAVAIAGDFHRVVGERVSVIRGAARELRRRLGERIRALGPGPAYLELIDQAVRDATEARSYELLSQVPQQLVRQFKVDLAAALAALPANATSGHLEGWYALDGWLSNHVRRCRDALRAVCQHEAHALKGLVAAVDEMVANAAGPAPTGPVPTGRTQQ